MLNEKVHRKSIYQTSVAQSLKLASQVYIDHYDLTPISDATVVHFG